MNLFDDIRTLVAYLRGSADVTFGAARQALANLAKAGLDWWAAQPTPLPLAQVTLDLAHGPSVADYLEAQCPGEASASPAAALPWNILLPIVFDLLMRWLAR